MTTEVIAAVREHGEKFDRALKEVSARLLDVEQKAAGPMTIATKAANPFEQVVNDPGVIALRKRQTKSATIAIDGGLSLLRKSTIVSDTPDEATLIEIRRALRLP